MASPLNWFRRNAIFIMVPVGIFCMAFFGLGAVFEQFATDIRSGGTRENPVIATWKKGEFTRDRINDIAQDHFGVRRFLNGLEEVGRAERGEEFVRLVTPVAPINDGQQDYINEQVISRYLMAERAKEEGLIVSEAMIDDYLSLAAGGAEISARQMKEINRDVNGGRIPMIAIRRQLEIELLNQKMMLLSYSGVPRVPNVTESIEHFGKTARKVDCEVIPVSVKDYVDDSASPTQSEIRKLFEEGKFEFRDPTGKRPGFKLPRRMKMQYFAGSYDSFLTKVSADLTDKEIQATYDELVKQESDLVMEIVPSESVDLPTADAGDDDSASESNESEGDESDPAPAPSSSTDEAAPDNSFNVSSSKFQLVSTPIDDEGDTTSETPAAEPADAGTENSDVAADNKSETDAPGDGDVDAATADETVTEAAMSEETATEEAPSEEAPSEEAPSEEAPSEEAPSEEVMTEEKTTEASTSEEEATKEDSTGEATADESTDAAPADGGLEAMLNSSDNSDNSDSADDDGIGPLLGDEDDSIVKRAKPLKEVEAIIRRQIKGADASRAFQEALQTAESAVENYNLELLQWDEGRDSDEPKPEAPDFQAIADANGLRLAETELVDNEQLNQTELGKTLNFNPSTRSVDRLGDLIFDRFTNLDPYSTQTFSDNTKAFVYWPVELADTEIPKLEQCKDAVIDFWRLQKAFDAAKAAAEAIAAKAGPEKKLTEIDPDKAAPTGEFTWFQPRGQRAVFSNPIGVELPGEDFMETAFALEKGEAGVATNRTRDTIYVVQATTAAEPVSAYGDQYLKDQLFKFQRIPTDVGLVNGHYFQEKQMDWNREYVDSMDFEFMK